MRIDLAEGPLETVDADLLAFPVFDPVTLPPFAARLEGDTRGRPGETAVLHREDGSRLVAAGAGRRADVDADSLRDAAAGVARLGAGSSVAWQLDRSLELPLDEQARAVADGLVLGGYDPARWRSRPPERKEIERVVLVDGSEASERAAERASRIAAWTNRARDLVNRPPNDLTPERLADRATEIATGYESLTAEALGADEIRALGMGAFAAVAQGSHHLPRLIVMRHEPPDPRPYLTLGLVGKAITFDTGGISIKPAQAMEEMKGDMAGGAAVVEAMGAIAELGVPLGVIAVVAAAENMPGGGAYRPGDILTAMNGKTIEVINTDAEGRLVLADALWHCRGQGATHIVDLATLTGVMEMALGDFYAGVFGNETGWRDQVVAAAEASGDHAWPFPLHRRYRRYIESAFADMKNSSILRQGSPVLAGEFLQEFSGDGPWAHIDMAGPGFLTRSRGDYLSQPGGTGYGVRLIAELATRLTESE